MKIFLYYENEATLPEDFDPEKTAASVIEAALELEGCPFDAEVNLLVTNEQGIRDANRSFRGIDAVTDVLSFPNIDFTAPSEFDMITDGDIDSFDPENGAIVLGDIVICAERLEAQAREYGHSPLREWAFLVAHSILHLCGYDHEDEGCAAVMEAKQELILSGLGITRDI